jgi:hypothetical protein
MVAGSKESWSLKSQELARDHHAPRVTVTRESRWESQRLFFPCLANLNLFAHSQRSVLHYIRAISQGITCGIVLGGPVIEDLKTGPRPYDQSRGQKWDRSWPQAEAFDTM